MAEDPKRLSPSIVEVRRGKKLPTGGSHPFKPRLTRTASGREGIKRDTVLKGPKRGKSGFVDKDGHI